MGVLRREWFSLRTRLARGDMTARMVILRFARRTRSRRLVPGARVEWFHRSPPSRSVVVGTAAAAAIVGVACATFANRTLWRDTLRLATIGYLFPLGVGSRYLLNDWLRRDRSVSKWRGFELSGEQMCGVADGPFAEAAGMAIPAARLGILVTALSCHRDAVCSPAGATPCADRPCHYLTVRVPFLETLSDEAWLYVCQSVCQSIDQSIK